MIMKYDFSNSEYMSRFEDYTRHRLDKTGAYDQGLSLGEKQARLDKEFFAEVSRLSGVNYADNNIQKNAWMANPSVRWAAFSIVNKQIDIVVKLLDNPVLDSLCEMTSVDLGDTVKIDVAPGYRYTVSAGSNGERMSNRQRKFQGEIILAPKTHQIATFTKLFAVLAGKESASNVAFQVAESINLAKRQDAFEILRKHMETDSVSFRGTASANDIIKVCSYIEQVNGVKPSIYGTAAAVAQLPGKAGSQWHFNVDGQGANLGFVETFYGYDVAIMPAVLNSYDPKAAGAYWTQTSDLDAEFGGAISIGSSVSMNDYLYVLSSMNTKPIQGVVCTDQSEVFDPRQFADLTETMTFNASWDYACVSPYNDAVIKLS